MLDITVVRERPDAVREAARRKRIDLPVDRLLQVDTERRTALTEVEGIRAEKNRVSKQLPKLSGVEKAAAIDGMKLASTRERELDLSLQQLESEFQALCLRVPNLPDDDVPDGTSDADNPVLRTWGEPPQEGERRRDHIELGQIHDFLDFTRAVKLAGSRNYILKGDLARLHMALIRFAVDFAEKRGFTPFIVPHLVRDEPMIGTAYFPGGEEQAYRCERDGLNLIGTAEVPVTAYHGDEILSEAELPKRYLGLSSCYRREAGAAGKDTRGLYRVHQFEKVEQVVIAPADDASSARLHEEITENAEAILQALELPYRVVLVCAGEMGLGQARKYDIETWMPSRGSYGETHSASKFYDFQARRMMLRYRDDAGKIRYCHTLNNTLVASPRILIPILEMYQEPDGSIRVPEVLRAFMGKDRIERR